MSNIPKALRYTRTHEWVKKEDDVYVVGITDHAQNMLGDLVYIELPEVESHLENGQECAVVESVKAAADIYSPLAGEIVEVNEAAIENPQIVNEDPYGKGWLFRIRLFEGETVELLTAGEYSQQVASEAH
jgi:glycine cleavage system H protein